MSTTHFTGLAMVIYVVAAVTSLVQASSRARLVRVAAIAVAAAAVVLHTAGIASRVFEGGRLPLANTYETLLVFSWLLALLTLWVKKAYRVPVLEGLALLLVFLLLAMSSLPQIATDAEPLVPSLRSNWLLAHVLTCFIAYAAFGLAFAGGAVCLVLSMLRSTPGRTQLAQRLENVAFRAIGLGFPLLTVGIVTGAVWANACWGRYWSWDPKETWSLITWLVYSAFLHLRYVLGWSGRAAAILAVVGFACVIFTYLGVNYLFTTAHNYA